MTEKGTVLPIRLTEPDAARELGISIGSLRALRKSGQIGHVRILNKIFYLPDQLKAYFNSHCIEPCQTTPTSQGISRDIGSKPNPDATRASGTGHGTIDPAVRSAASRLARETFRRPTAR
ncbi:helix-turn-helix domain-containing protein [Azospirillum picis]|uniref:Helix-turn-helix domain-containing protein n=1 Tax=Azospirillum picis TaxID=488438 RepID=A0ABU0MEN4_9PROT|nr:helix-turn-helix domain-containing protein [Azospirillum picis]MBP2297990.1 hypothetical protein [Azospirillum picis]MDQ0531828.1 hypothetical protein [Azospirillum picis]